MAHPRRTRRYAVMAALVFLVLLWRPWAMGFVPDTPTAAPEEPRAPRTSPPVRGGAAAVPRPVGAFANDGAIRAPLRDPAPLFGTLTPPAPGTPVLRGSPAAARCYSATGAPAAVPAWAADLFRLMSAAQYRALVGEADRAWAVLIGWTPARFMGPQKPGRRANGDPMIPPTLGRDPATYHAVFNATWHAVAESGVHYQLVHRNALAVCVRERLHVHALRCAPDAEASPVLVHFCPCRHCPDTVVASPPPDAAPLPLPFPSSVVTVPRELAALYPLRNAPPPPLRLPPPDGDPAMRYSGPCVLGDAAPWLVPKDVVPRFEYEGLEGDLAALLRVQSRGTGLVLVAIFNQFWLDHLHNFVYSLRAMAHTGGLVVATMDDQSLALCVAQRLPCLDATAYAEAEPVLREGQAGFKAGHVRKVTEAMSWIKPRLAVAVLERGVGFFMVDLDLSWNAFPLHEVLAARVDLAHQCDAPSPNSINSGFYFARPGPRAWHYFRNLMSFRPEENSDQTAMKLFVRYDHTFGALSSACLGKHAFDMKCNYKVPKSVRVVGGVETFRWAPVERDPAKFRWRIMHATCLNGAAAKMRWLRTIGAWRLDALDNATRQPYCVALREGSQYRVVEGVTGQTHHSSKYTTAMDRLYLQDRH